MVERIPEEMHIATLPSGFWKYFLNRSPDARMVITDYEFDSA
jgi:hypothetical protein